MLLKRVIKILRYFLLLLVILFVAIVAGINLPVSQRLISEKINGLFIKRDLPVRVESVTLLINGRIALKNLVIKNEDQDTVVSAGKIGIRVRILPLAFRKVIVKKITIHDASVRISVDSITHKPDLISLFIKDGRPASEVKKQGRKWEINAKSLSLENIRFSYIDPGKGLRIEQSVGKLNVEVEDFSLLRKVVYVSDLDLDRIDGGISIYPSDKLPQEKVRSGTRALWDFKLARSVIREVLFTLEQPANNNKLDFSIGKGEISSAAFNLAAMRILAGKAEIEDGSFRQNHYTEKISQDDSINSFQVEGINTSFRDIRLSKGSSGFSMESLSLILGNGFRISRGELKMSSDSVAGSRIRAELKTASSLLNISIDAEKHFTEAISSFREVPFTLKIENSTIAAEEILGFLPGLKVQPSLKKKEKTLIGVSADVTGTAENLRIGNISLKTSSGFSILVSGNVTGIMNPSSGIYSLYFRTGELIPSQVTELIGLTGKAVEIPHFEPMTIEGNIDSTLTTPLFNIKLKGNSGNIALNGSLDIPRKGYAVKMNFVGVEAGRLSGVSDLGRVTGEIDLTGKEFIPERMELNASLRIDSARFRNYDYGGIRIESKGKEGDFLFNITSGDSNFKSDLEGSVEIRDLSVLGTLSGSMAIDAGRLNILKGTSVSASLEARLNRSNAAFEGFLSLKNLNVTREGITEDLNEVDFSFLSSDTLSSGKIETDFIKADAYYKGSPGGLFKVLKENRFAGFASVDSAVRNRIPYISRISEMKISLQSDYDPFLRLFVADSIFSYNTVSASIIKDLSGNANLKVLIDRINAGKSEVFNASVILEYLPQKSVLDVKADSVKHGMMTFSEISSGITVEGDSALFRLKAGTKTDTLIYDIQGRAIKDESGIRLGATREDWVINGWPWAISRGDFLVLKPQHNDFVADLHLLNGRHSIDIYGRKSEKLYLETKDISLKMLLIPGLENFRYDAVLTGKADFRGRNGEKELGIMMDLNEIRIDDTRLGYLNLSGNILYDTLGNVNSDFNAILNDTSGIKLSLKADASSGMKTIRTEFSDIRVKNLEPLAEKYVSGLSGLVSGSLDMVVKGRRPELNGEVNMKGITLKLIPVNAWFYLPDNSIAIENSILRFNRFTILDSLRNPLTLNGFIEMGDPGNILTDLQLTSDHIKVMNTTSRENNVFNGDIFINSRINLKGPLQRPSISGNIVLAEGTVINYNYAENLSVSETQKTITFAALSQDPMAEAKAVSSPVRLTRSPDIEATVEIDPRSLFNFQISRGFDIGISITGGGFLTYSVMPNNEIDLSGIYEISEGASQLKIPGWPRKDFVITKGSTVKWDGKIDNPNLNIETTSKVRGSYVNPVDNMTREVNFLVYMKLYGRFSELEIVFDVRSEDQYITTFFNTLSADERMRQAINLLIFERVELPGQTSSSNYLSQQINQFAENQLNQATKSASKKLDLDVSVGLDTYTRATTTGEQTTTSLSYQVKKNMFNERGSVLLSGHTNYNTTASEQGNAVIENFIFEYALDSVRTKFLKVYRQQNYEDLLEGEVIKSGIGFIYRKNYDRISDIWRRQKKGEK